MTNTYGQGIELHGRYGASFIGSEHIDFVGKDSFYFSGFYCTYGVYGKGRCEIRDNYLYLYFEKSKPKEIDSLKPPIIASTRCRDAFSVIQLSVVDNKGIPVRHAALDLVRINASNWGTTTDTLGKATIKINSNTFPVIIKTSAIGFEPGKLRLDNSSNYTITVFLKRDASFDKVKNNGEVSIYEIDELSEDLILMRPQKSTEPFREYRKMK